MTTPTPRPLKVTLLSGPECPLETLFYVWQQSRENRELPTPQHMSLLLTEQPRDNHDAHWFVAKLRKLGYSVPENDPETLKASLDVFRTNFHATVQMILNESIPVTENLFFVFHLENIPISLREQLVRHRIGTQIDPRVGMDIVPSQPSDLMGMRIVPDQAESTWWSQTSRVINQGAFYDEGRFLLPESLQGKTVKDIAYGRGDHGEDLPITRSAEDFYRRTLRTIQGAYNALVEAGVHIEDARQLIPVGATHGITWGLNLKAMMHIFGKRSSWIAQVGIWEGVMGQMVQELCDKVSPVFRQVLQPACIKQGKYVGCPVNGTNVERVQGTDGMPPCPIWVRYQTQDAMKAWREGNAQTVSDAGWTPPSPDLQQDLRTWSGPPVQREMLERTAAKFSKLWQLDVFNSQLEVV